MAQGPQVKVRERMPKGPKIAREALQIGRIPAPSHASGANTGATWLRNVPPQQRLNQPGCNQGNAAHPPPALTTTANSRPPAFPPWPQTKTNHTESSSKERMTRGFPCSFLNPDPVTHLVGCPNEAPVIVDGQEMTALIASGAQVSSISSQFCGDLALQIQPLGWFLELEGTGGSAIPYLWFVEVNL